MKINNKKIIKEAKDIAETISNAFRSTSKLECYLLAVKVLMLAKRVSKGLLTESDALGLLTRNANTAAICLGISISVDILLEILEAAEKSIKRKEAKEKAKHIDDVEDLDNEVDDIDDNLDDIDPEPAM